MSFFLIPQPSIALLAASESDAFSMTDKVVLISFATITILTVSILLIALIDILHNRSKCIRIIKANNQLKVQSSQQNSTGSSSDISRLMNRSLKNLCMSHPEILSESDLEESLHHIENNTLPKN